MMNQLDEILSESGLDELPDHKLEEIETRIDFNNVVEMNSYSEEKRNSLIYKSKVVRKKAEKLKILRAVGYDLSKI